MSGAALDRLLGVLVVAMAGTGLVTLRAGSPGSGWVYVLHGLLAGALAAAVALKLGRSVPRAAGARHWGRLALGLLVALLAAAALSGGWLWVASGEILSVGSWTVLTLHAWAGLTLVPLVVVHLLPKRWRLLRPPRRGPDRTLSRRTFVAGALFGLAGLGAFGAAAMVEILRGGRRRFTGSRLLPPGGVPPPTTFYGEPAPTVDPAAWRLRVRGRVERALELDLAALAAVEATDPSVSTAVLDCTSGWALETTWRGVALATLLDRAGVAAGAGAVTVRSATGWAAVLPLDEARGTLLATSVAGRPLPVANGAPVRLVVPDRRGLDWIKWVTEVTVG